MLVVKILTIFLFFMLGGSLASGISCAVWRKKHGESWLKTARSHCDSCGHVLSATDLVPVLSYIVLRGKCKYCGAKIPAASSFVWELAAGTVAAVLCYAIIA